MTKIRLKFNRLFRRVNRKYRDALFQRCFSNKRDLLELYNALNGTSYDDIEELEITTLEDCIYMTYKNDLSFIISATMNLYEHQSTYNPNMPIRGLMYFARLYEAYIKKHKLDIYGRTLITLPEPRYVIFYNGTDNQPDKQTLRLSDAFKKNENSPESIPALECMATMLNINYGHNKELLDKCKRLHDYSFFITEVNCNFAAGHSIETAIEMATDQCIQKNILEDILLKQKSEVFHLLLNEFSLKDYVRGIREEERQIRLELIQTYDNALAEKDFEIARLREKLKETQEKGD